MSWRDRASVVIAEVLERTKGQPEEVIAKALRDAYPFGARKWFPYKVWLDEIKVQRGLKPQRSGTAASDARKLAEWEAIYGRRSA